MERLYRRKHFRVPIRLFVDQFRGQEHWVGVSYNLSPGGVYLCQRPQPIPSELGIELELPGLPDSIWTRAEVRSVGDHGGFMGIGLAFTAMASAHERMLQSWVRTTRRRLRIKGYERRSPTRRLLAA